MARMRAEDRKRQLLEVAAEQFATNGYRGTTTAALAEAAGITEPILYRHFENKLDLFVCLIEEVGREVIRRWQAALDGAKDSAARLEILLASNPAIVPAGRGVYRVIFAAMTDGESEPAIAAAINNHMRALHTFLKRELANLQKEGVVGTDESAAGLAWMLISIAIGYGMLAPTGLTTRGAGSKTAMQRMIRDLVQS